MALSGLMSVGATRALAATASLLSLAGTAGAQKAPRGPVVAPPPASFTKFDSTKLKAYPAGSFILIPAGVPHFVATKDGTVIVQLSGNSKFQTDYVEK